MTSGSSPSGPKVAVIARSGRTHSSRPVPQRIGLPQGKPLMTSGSTVERMSMAGAPFFSITAT